MPLGQIHSPSRRRIQSLVEKSEGLAGLLAMIHTPSRERIRDSATPGVGRYNGSRAPGWMLGGLGQGAELFGSLGVTIIAASVGGYLLWTKVLKPA